MTAPSSKPIEAEGADKGDRYAVFPDVRPPTPLEAEKELDELIAGYDTGWNWSAGRGGDLKKALTRDALITALLAWRDKAVVAEQLDILEWATGGIKEFTEDGKIYIPKKIDELTAQLRAIMEIKEL